MSKMVKKLEALSELYHCAFVNQIQDQNKLVEEQAVLNNHETKVEDQMKRLEDQVVTTEPMMPHTSGMGDHRPVVGSITKMEHLG